MKAHKSIIYFLCIALACFTLPVQAAPEHCDDMSAKEMPMMMEGHEHHQMNMASEDTVSQSEHECCGDDCQCNVTSCQNPSIAILVAPNSASAPPLSGLAISYLVGPLPYLPPNIEYPPQITA